MLNIWVQYWGSILGLNIELIIGFKIGFNIGFNIGVQYLVQYIYIDLFIELLWFTVIRRKIVVSRVYKLLSQFTQRLSMRCCNSSFLSSAPR